MAKFTLNCEFDSVEELREFLSDNSAQQFEAESKPEKTERKRRTKAELAALAVGVEDRPIVKGDAKVIPETAIEVLPPAHEQPLVGGNPPPPTFNFVPGVIPTFGATATPQPTQAPVGLTISNQPVVEVKAGAPVETLPGDLLMALGSS